MTTPDKMLKYLRKIDGLGLKQVRVIVPADSEHEVAAYADSMRQEYLRKIAATAGPSDKRLKELASGRLATGVKPSQIAEWRQKLDKSQHILFDRKCLTMQQAWSNMVSAVQAKHAAMMRDDEAETTRHSALAVVAALAFRSAKDDLTQYVASCAVPT